MGILTWSDQLLVGIDSVDRQHQRLVDLINRLDEVVALGEDHQTLLETVNQLVEYTVYHFNHEEELMQNAGYNLDMMTRHHQQHQEFIDKMLRVQADAQLDASVVSKDLLNFLVDWLCHHTLKTDKVMAISLNKGIDATQITIDREEQVDIMHSNLYSALRESEDRFKELADNLQALIWVTNAKHLPIFCNQHWFKTFGFKPGQVDKQKWINTIHPSDRDRVCSAYEQAADELSKLQIEYRLCLADNSEIWILETAVPRIRQNGVFAGLMGCGMDITTQKQAETTLAEINQQLEELVNQRTQALLTANQTLELEKNQQTLLNQQLQEAQTHLIQSEKMASIGQLAAGVAHEINNPLGYIFTNLNSLTRYIQDLVKAAELSEHLIQQLPVDNVDVLNYKQFIKTIDLSFLKEDALDLVAESLEGASRAKRIVQDLRDFSRIDKQERALFDVEAGLNATLNIVNNELKYKAEIIKEFSGLTPIECVGAQLNQVFMNLLINAAQAIEEFGKITIRTGHQDAGWVWVEIEDTGNGMSEATKARIFDPFFTTKPVGKGTGLGLSLSYKIINDHNGRFEVDSQPGKGTRFRIYLPTYTVA